MTTLNIGAINCISPTEGYFSQHTAYWHIQAAKQVKSSASLRKKKREKCIVCNILTSTVTELLQKYFSVIEVNE